MGIPSYFSYIIKNYTNIIRSLSNISFNNDNKNGKFTHLYMDCNSIVYDSYYELDKVEVESIEDIIIDSVISKIEYYIKLLNPTKCIYIAFDGVAPFAKMEQQKLRRYKSSFTAIFNNEYIRKEIKNKWNTSSITPGTQFMYKLNEKLKYHFNHSEHRYKCKEVIVSCSDEHGEGEQKLFSHIRSSSINSDRISVYGLDSDLIMLSIFHLSYCKNIFIFREAPEFLRNSIPVDVSDNQPYFVDIDSLQYGIMEHMNCEYNNKQRIRDYVFLCFFLGNDFLPHFPSMNIRTHGMDVLLDTYKMTLGNKKDEYLINEENGKIDWINVNKYINKVQEKEEDYLKQEHSNRNRFDSYKFGETTKEEKEKALQNTPIIYRREEKYISPHDYGWEDRYYKSLFGKERKPKNIKEICNNYIEGLEWVHVYYTHDCIDWKWKYNYHYPPLFKDLIKYIPHFQMEYFSNSKKPDIFSPYTQLAYVLPKDNLYLLPKEKELWLLKNYKEYYPDNYNFIWAYCRYFWEAHPIVKGIPIPELNNIDTILRS